jgi:hypothetical protein
MLPVARSFLNAFVYTIHTEAQETMECLQLRMQIYLMITLPGENML